MILDFLTASDPYAPLGARFAAGFAFLRDTDLASLADGQYPIDGTDVFAIVQTNETKHRRQGRWEAHRAHADIQLVVSGTERMGVAPMDSMEMPPQSPYDAQKDVEFYQARRGGQFFDVEPGQFALFFPHDVHMPGLMTVTVQTVKKVVVKVRVR